MYESICLSVSVSNKSLNSFKKLFVLTNFALVYVRDSGGHRPPRGHGRNCAPGGGELRPQRALFTICASHL